MKFIVVGQPRGGGVEELSATSSRNQDVANEGSHGCDEIAGNIRSGSAAAFASSEVTPLLPKKRRPSEEGDIGTSVGSVLVRRRSVVAGAALSLIAMSVMLLAFGGSGGRRVGSIGGFGGDGRGRGWGLWGLVNHRSRHHHSHKERESRHPACDPIWRALAEAVEDEQTSPRRHGHERDLHEHHHEDHSHHDSSEHHYHHQASHGVSGDRAGTRDVTPHDAQFHGRILYSDRHQDAKDFDAAVRVWNERYNAEKGGRHHHSRIGGGGGPGRSLPCAIVLPSNENDVALIVPILVRHNVELVIKSGGHCYADYSSATSSTPTTTASEGTDSSSVPSAPRVLLDLGPLSDLHFDVDTSNDHGDTVRAIMGPGTTMGQILHQKGLHDDLANHHHDTHHKNKDEYYYAGVLGSSSTVAAGGYILGGGYGYWSRKHGLAIDNLVGARVVLANGTVVVANPSQHSDLFWALRGAGQATFGVVTQYTYRLYRAHRNLLVATAFQLSPQDLIPLLVAAPGGDTEVSSLTYPADCHMEVMGTDVGAELDVACLGATERDLEKLQEQVKAYMKERVPSNVNKKLLYNRTSWVAMAQAETDNFQGIMVQYWNGLLSPSSNNVETWQRLIDALFGLAHKNPHVLVDFELRGGAIAKVDPAATAYPWRNAAYMVGIGVIVSPAERHADAVFREQVDRVNTVWDLDIAPHLEGMFPNYAMESLHDAKPEDASRLAWGDNLSRLQEIKASYDPTNFFHSALPIELAPPAPLIPEEDADHAPTPGPSPEVSLPPTAQPTAREVVVTDLPTVGPSTNPTASDTAFPSFALYEGGEDGDVTAATPTMPPSISERMESPNPSGAPAVPATTSPPLSTPPVPDAGKSASS